MDRYACARRRATSLIDGQAGPRERRLGLHVRAHRAVRGLVAELTAFGEHRITDMEAGLEHLKRGTARHVDMMLVVAEPYYRRSRRRCAPASARRGARHRAHQGGGQQGALGRRPRGDRRVLPASNRTRSSASTRTTMPMVDAEREGLLALRPRPGLAPAIAAIRDDRRADRRAGRTRARRGASSEGGARSAPCRRASLVASVGTAPMPSASSSRLELCCCDGDGALRHYRSAAWHPAVVLAGGYRLARARPSGPAW